MPRPRLPLEAIAPHRPARGPQALATVLASAIAVALAGAAPGTHAATLSYGYSGTFTSGPLLGDSFTGQFSFDDSLAAPNALRLGAGLIADLEITVEGVTYDENDAPLAALAFNAAGHLSAFLFGNRCTLTQTLFCSAGPSVPGSWYAVHDAFGYTGVNAQPDDPAISFALNPIWGPIAGVPEPSTPALLLAALAALPLARRFRPSPSRPPVAATA